jgi:hypothetical protein
MHGSATKFSKILSQMYICIQVKHPFSWAEFNETWILSTEFREILQYQFHENPFSGSRVVPCGQTDGHDEVISAQKKTLCGQNVVFWNIKPDGTQSNYWL